MIREFDSEINAENGKPEKFTISDTNMHSNSEECLKANCMYILKIDHLLLFTNLIFQYNQHARGARVL